MSGIFLMQAFLSERSCWVIRGIPKFIRWSKRQDAVTFVPVHQSEF
jgi:hypothetical protein